MPTNRPKGLKRCAMCGKVWFSRVIYISKLDHKTKVCVECEELIATEDKLISRGRRLSGATII